MTGKKINRTVIRTINKYSMFQAGESVLIGVSGGPDSVALLYILYTLAPSLNINLGVAHLNHCLRKKEADQDADFVSSLSDKLNLPCFIDSEDVIHYYKTHKFSLEEAAREVRYQFYQSVAENNGFSKIALGHNCNDNAELVLMNLFRGSGLRGISGIPPVRDAKIVRPLIETSRAEIIEYLKEKKAAYVIDRTNQDERYLRNRIRNKLIPDLKKFYNPQIIETLNRLSSILRAEDDWIEETIESMMGQIVLDRKGNAMALSFPALNRLPVALKRRVIRSALKSVKGNLRRISFEHIESIITLMKTGMFEARLDLPDNILVSLSKNAILFSKNPTLSDKNKLTKAGPNAPLFEYVLYEAELRRGQPETVSVPEAGIILQFSKISIKSLPDFRNVGQHVAFFDMDSLKFPLIIRNFKPGDRFYPLGLGGSQKLKKYFNQKKLSRAQRLKCPLLLSKGKIIWVAGHRIDEFVKIRSSTARVLKAELLLA